MSDLVLAALYGTPEARLRDREAAQNARRTQLLEAEQHDAKAIAALATMRADFASAYDDLLPRIMAGIMACDAAIAAINASRAARGQPAISEASR